MSKLTVICNLTLDGIMQAPGRPDEDPRGGFEHGGWAVPYSSDAMGRLMAQGMGGTSALLLGRRTYQDFAGFWPKQQDNPFTEVLDHTRKYVTSKSLSEPLPWVNSTLLGGDAGDSVAKLKQNEPDQDLVVLGSGELVGSLLQAGLIDEFRLLIHPLVLGQGRRLFPEGTQVAALRLTDTVGTSTGVVIATYNPAST